MSVTESLLRVFRVDQQLRGLTSRLTAAERFLAEQTKQLELLLAKRGAAEGQLRVLKVQAAEREGEMKGYDERIEKLKEQMNGAQTNKEYKALLTEINTYKADKSSVETEALTVLTKVDELAKQVAELDALIVEREKVRKVAETERAAKAAEIADRVNELKAQRAQAASQVPPKVMSLYVELVRTHGEEAMAPVEELDRKRHEYTCGSCRMTVPVERVATLMMSSASAEIIRCASCGCVLYIETATAERFHVPGAPKPAGKGGKKGKREEAAESEV